VCNVFLSELLQWQHSRWYVTCQTWDCQYWFWWPWFFSGQFHNILTDSLSSKCRDRKNSWCTRSLFLHVVLQFVFNMDQGLLVWSEWLVFNRVNAPTRKGLVLGPMRLLLRYILHLLSWLARKILNLFFLPSTVSLKNSCNLNCWLLWVFLQNV